MVYKIRILSLFVMPRFITLGHVSCVFGLPVSGTVTVTVSAGDHLFHLPCNVAHVDLPLPSCFVTVIVTVRAGGVLFGLSLL